MNKWIIGFVIPAFIVSDIRGQAQTNITVASAGESQTSTTFIDTVLKFLGISYTPGTLKGPGDRVISGSLWLADLDSGSIRALTSSASYRSPVFLPGTNHVLALQGTGGVVQVPCRGGEGKKLYFVQDIVKLVGALRDDPEKVLILLRGAADGHPRVGILTVATGAVTALPYDIASSHDLQMVEDLEGWSRTYGDRRIYVDRKTKQAFSGTIEWSDVFLEVASQEPVDVSQGDGVNCGQPSLSENGRLLVFVKAEAQ